MEEGWQVWPCSPYVPRSPVPVQPCRQGPKKGPCCSATGFCGNTDNHCSCLNCVNYGMVREPWRSDGRCGKKFPMINGKPHQCNPKLSGRRKGPCCSASGYCGNTEKHCSCNTCVDYSKAQDGDAADKKKMQLIVISLKMKRKLQMKMAQ